MKRTGTFHPELSRRKRCKSRSRTRGQTFCQLSLPAQCQTSDLTLSLNITLLQDHHSETQEKWAKLVLGKQILPTPKIMNKITNSIFLKGEEVEGRETRQKGMRECTGGSTCLWSHLGSPSASTSAHIGSGTHAELSCLESWAVPCSREEMLHQLLPFHTFTKISLAFSILILHLQPLLHKEALPQPFRSGTPKQGSWLKFLLHLLHLMI